MLLMTFINSQKEEQWGEEPFMIWMIGRSLWFKRIRRFTDSYFVWTLWMSFGVRNLTFWFDRKRRWPFSNSSLTHFSDFLQSSSFERLRLMNHNEFIVWRTVMFSVLCIYEIHRISQNPMFTMVFDDLFSFRKPAEVACRVSPRRNRRSFVRRDISSSNASCQRSSWRFCARRAITWSTWCMRRWIGWALITSTLATVTNATTSPSNTIARRDWASLCSVNWWLNLSRNPRWHGVSILRSIRR